MEGLTPAERNLLLASLWELWKAINRKIQSAKRSRDRSSDPGHIDFLVGAIGRHEARRARVEALIARIDATKPTLDNAADASLLV